MSADAAILERIKAVDPVHAETMGRQPTTFTSHSVPFYRRFKLLRAIVRLRHKPLEFRYADDGTRLIQLGGAAEDVYKVNQAEGLTLAEDQVAAYVRFFLANAESRKWSLVERGEDAGFVAATQTDAALGQARAAASAHMHPVTVSKAAQGYQVSATALQGKRLAELLLSVAADGRVALEAEKTLAEGLPVAEKL